MSTHALKNVVWNYPTHIRFGAGSIKNISRICKKLGISKPLVVTDQGLADATFVQEVCHLVHDAGLSSALYSRIKGNPIGENVDEGVAVFKRGAHDGVIAVGGGSALDASKIIALMAKQSETLWDFGGKADDWSGIHRSQVAPLIAIPTTAGTGSEVGRAAVITDERHHVKKIISHAALMPLAVILDPELTCKLPPHLTAATGLDAFVHCFEAFCVPAYHPMADGIALEGIHLVSRSLPQAYAHGDDLPARGDMLVAASLGAMAFQKGLGGVHALAHGIGALFDTHHGLTNAVLLPYVMKANRPAIEGQMGRVAEALAIPDISFQGVLDWVLATRRALGLAHTLSEIGVPSDRCSDISALAKADPCDATNPQELTQEDYIHIVQCALDGKL